QFLFIRSGRGWGLFRAFGRSRELAERRHDLDTSSADPVAHTRPTRRYAVTNRNPKAVPEKPVDVLVYLLFRDGIDYPSAQLLHLAAELSYKSLVGRPCGLRALEHRRLCFSPAG